MALARIHGVDLHYEILGVQGPWVSLVSGGRRSAQEWRTVACALADQGFRVLLHDRRNTGDSGWCPVPGRGEDEVWAEDWAALMEQIGAHAAFWGGGSSGARLALQVARQVPQRVLGLLLVRITGGAFTAARLPHSYYGQYIEAARQGGMPAVCAQPFFEDYLHNKPDVRAQLLAMDPALYIALQEEALSIFAQGPREPVLGMPLQDLRAIQAPTWIVPGNDRTHVARHAREAAALMPNARLFELPLAEADVPSLPFSAWEPHQAQLVQGMIDFMREVLHSRASPANPANPASPAQTPTP